MGKMKTNSSIVSRCMREVLDHRPRVWCGSVQESISPSLFCPRKKTSEMGVLGNRFTHRSFLGAFDCLSDARAVLILTNDETFSAFSFGERS